jgi:SAM-dependent methyltransferase
VNSRNLAYALALLILVTVRLTIARQKSREPAPATAGQLEDAQPSVWRLLLASFLVLFAELAFIRWIAVEVRIFAYFKNLALLLCFLGFGMGCALVRKPARWRTAVNALFGLLLVIRLPWHHGWILEELSQNLGAGADMNIWRTYTVANLLGFALAAALSASLFLLVVWVFVPLGQEVSRQMNLASRPLTAYSLNLAASLVGILAFLAVSRLMLPPWIWLGIVLLGFALLQKNTKQRILLGSLLLPLILLLHDPSDHDHYSFWTPYQHIQFTRIYGSNSEMLAGHVQVNHVGYQLIVNLASDFLARHPGLLKEPLDENPYNVAFRFAVPAPSVLIVGSGTGNDVAAALRHDSSSVDAVEIDPAILEIGKKEHPEHPYDSPRVSVHLTDARAFLKRSTRQYDLILFGLLDSHTQLSDYANMRIDNFVYTEESFREANAHLKRDGIIFLKFEADRPWMVRRLKEMLTATFGKEPLIFNAESSYTVRASCFVISSSNRLQNVLNSDQRLADFVARHPVDSGNSDVPVTTDDWPYLYQRDKTIPRPYWSISAIIVLLSLGFYSRISDDAPRRRPSLFFFCMGAGFLLLETQVISRLALFFGTTWQVNGIAISAMLAALLLANAIVERSCKPLAPAWNLAALLAGLALAYWFPFGRIGGPPAVAGTVAVAVFSIPVVFAGMLFAAQFRVVDSKSAALGANLLGAVAGGLMENLSLVFGMRALLLIAIAVYAGAGIGLWRQQVTGVGTEVISHSVHP